MKKTRNTAKRHSHALLDADKLREDVKQILSISQKHYSISWENLLLSRPSYYVDEGGTPHYLEIQGKAYYFETGKKFYIGLPPAYDKILISPQKSTTAIKTVEQLLGISPTKTNIKTNFKNSCFGKGSQNIHKQHQQNSR